MGGFRHERIAALIHKELAERLRLEIKDPRLVEISITSVTVTRDLSIARISYMPLGGGAVGADTVEALDGAARTLRGRIGRVLRLRHAPELRFELDSHTEEAIRITQLLTRLETERRDRVDEDSGESS